MIRGTIHSKDASKERTAHHIGSSPVLLNALYAGPLQPSQASAKLASSSSSKSSDFLGGQAWPETNELRSNRHKEETGACQEHNADVIRGVAVDKEVAEQEGARSSPIHGNECSAAKTLMPNKKLNEKLSESHQGLMAARLFTGAKTAVVEAEHSSCETTHDAVHAMTAGSDAETLANFAQRWKFEAEKMTTLAQASISAQVI